MVQDSPAYLTQIALSLILIVAIIFAMAWLYKVFGRQSVIANDKLRVLAGLPVGTREKIILIQVGNEQILVGVTGSEIRTLHTLSENIEIEPEQVPKFAEYLKKQREKMQESKHD